MNGAHYSLSLTRDSVAAGDDVSAPHRSVLTVPAPVTGFDLCKAILSRDYLARISGGKATWVVELDEVPVGIIAQQWETPKSVVSDLNPSQNSQVHCRYLLQQDPDTVFAQYSDPDSGKPK
ncbi:hypothetical protein [Ruegeria sp. Ofav3-42]|uniref:hypothetical protein n=1 Tax=Ruegeria sp. Ofav3-42 TaxID=2917759 RepID=UPI001EF5895C|nr:hypothetical protein [Ruegeria sp. Ofav3-42]MCG7519168.1 hypothetical protein [Ruegeria sp. Ofav3-42]